RHSQQSKRDCIRKTSHRSLLPTTIVHLRAKLAWLGVKRRKLLRISTMAQIAILVILFRSRRPPHDGAAGKIMPKISCLGVLLFCLSAGAVDKPATIFQIGAADGDFHEFAIAGNEKNYPKQFPNDVNYVVGRSDAKQDWPFVHPGPVDVWGGS